MSLIQKSVSTKKRNQTDISWCWLRRAPLGLSVYAEFESKLMGYIDDVEFYFRPDSDSSSTVEYRTASRLGEGDFGANRSRIRDLRVALQNIVSLTIPLKSSNLSSRCKSPLRRHSASNLPQFSAIFPLLFRYNYYLVSQDSRWASTGY